MCLAVPGQILSIQEADEFRRNGRVSFGGVVKEVNLAYVPEAGVGDYVVVHVGFALSVVDEEEARQTLDYLRQMDELQELGDSEAPATGEVLSPGASPGTAG
ncbi:MAG: HypC/HybG/HupF family hydrogenase formation chaperone [Verrucomicrobiae bacterium]|nr:HypC/HybG/HupF family hydrogenase formation chaperone [Verrucomicrobiae bacterium]MCP5520053.1 HypC/HybG/HupF family hydrogenase formation chaperone [Verrucomicrobiales bacterium]